MLEETVKEWLDFAKMDFDTAVHVNETMHPKPLEIICYHCQQSAEKYLKALALNFGKPIEKTHDLTFLAEMLQDKTEISDDIYKICASLTKYGVATRYPMQIQIDQSNVDSAINDVKALQTWALSILEKE